MFGMPFFSDIIIVSTIFFWSLFKLLFTPFFGIFSFFLEFIVIFTPFWLRIKFLPLFTTLQTSRTLLSFCSYKL